MELVFDERKMLLPGVYEVTMATVKEQFGKFQKTDRRPNLFAKLEAYIEAVKKAVCGSSVIVDGSFVMACIEEPNDIDLVLVLPASWDRQADLRPFQYNLVSKRAIKTDFGFDVFVVEFGSTEEANWIDFFGQVGPKWATRFGWPDDLRKGILRVNL